MLESGRVRAYGKLKSEELAALKEELGELLEADLALVSGGVLYDEKVSKAGAEQYAGEVPECSRYGGAGGVSDDAGEADECAVACGGNSGGARD